MAATKHRNKKSLIQRLRPADALAALFILVLLIWLAAFGVRCVRSLRLEMVPAQRYTEDIRYSGSLVAVRSEYPILTVSEGVFTPALTAGSRVREQDVIGSCEWEGIRGTVVAGHTGLVYYDMDGWESILTPEAAETIDWRAIVAGLQRDGETPPTAADLSQGRVAARIVDNLSDTFVFFYGDDFPPDLAVGDSLTLCLPPEPEQEREQIITVTVLLTGTVDADTSCLWARVDSNVGTLYQRRFLTADIQGAVYSGISVPASSLFKVTVTEKDKDGNETTYIYDCVYACVGNRLAQRRVTILYQNEEIAVVRGLETGLPVVSNPELASVGQQVLVKQ